MAQSEPASAIETMEPATDISLGSRTPSRNLNINAVASGPDEPPKQPSTGAADLNYTDPPAYFDEALQDAERLLKYAAEVGIDIDSDTRDHVMQARAASSRGWNQETITNLLAALTKLASQLNPVTAESLKDNSRHTVHTYWWVAIVLAIVIVPFSLVSFVSSAISNTIRTDITTANDLAVKLRAQLGPSSPKIATILSLNDASAPPEPAQQLPPGVNQLDVIGELQLYASTIRAIDARARQLNALVFRSERDPFPETRGNPGEQRRIFQLPVGLPNLGKALDARTYVYQEERYFAQNLLDDVSVYYGAVTVCLLPVLYALLGTCAYLLRTFEKQMALRTFVPSAANSARFLIAAIGGGVVGLFGNFNIAEGVSIPPLAIAFLVGYAVDVFFAFLEGLLQTFAKNPTTSPAPAVAAGS